MAGDESSFVVFLKDFSPAITVLVAMVGWWVNNQSADTRETRKEVRSDISEIKACITSIVDLIEGYFLPEHEDTTHDAAKRKNEEIRFDRVRLQVNVTFKSLDMRLELLAERLRKDGGKLLDLRDALDYSSRFYDLASGDGLRMVEFGDALAMQSYYGFVSRVHVAALTLIDAIDRSVIKAFQ